MASPPQAERYADRGFLGGGASLPDLAVQKLLGELLSRGPG